MPKMTKTEARSWLARARQGLRDAEQALKDNDLEALSEALVEATAAPAEVQAALHGDFEPPRGIRGIN